MEVVAEEVEDNMFNVNLENNEIVLDEELNKVLNGLKIDYTQFYRGIVVDNRDPELKGRIKVRIPQIYGVDTATDYFVPTNAIPWANCAILPAGNDSGSFLPPNIGDTVFVTFESGHSSAPIYFGGIYTKRSEDDSVKGVASTQIFDNTVNPVTVDDMPQEVINGTERVLYKSLKGAIIYIDDKDGAECIRITDQSGQSIIMENLSLETLKRRGNKTGKNPKSQIVLTNSAGDSITLSQGKIHLKSPNIIIETDNLEQVGLDEFEDETTMADIILGEEGDTGLYTFVIKEARTGEFVPNLNYVISILNENTGRYIVYTQGITSDEETIVELPKDSIYKITVAGDGWYDSNYDFNTNTDSPTTINIFMTRITTEDILEIVLTWNGVISDMDSHTRVYDQNDSFIKKVYYGDKQYSVDGTNIVKLDVDDTDYYGPETTTIQCSYPYKYLFYVHRYTSGQDIATSESNIKVYRNGDLINDINIPEGTYSLDYQFWNVLTYNALTNELEIINEVTPNEPGV